MGSATHLDEALTEARRRTDELFELLVPEAYYDRPIPERHRNIFYLGHLEAFDWNLIGGKTLALPPIHPTFDKLFEFGIDPPVGRPPEDQPSDWPTVDEVSRYAARARAAIDRVRAEGQVPDEIWHVAIEHRLMHAETFAYMLHNLPAERKIEPPGTPRDVAEPDVVERMIEVPKGTATLGRKHDGFGWDNEFDQHTIEVPAFTMSQHKVSNGEYLEFVRAGADAPHFWVRRGDKWFQRTMFGLAPLPLTWPVYVTQQQAAAFARWKAKSLPTEAQFHRVAYATNANSGNYDFRRWDPVPVTVSSSGNPFGISQLLGNGWEWTSTVFEPFPGFAPFSFYPGYSANFFDGEHYVMKGASARTAACFLRPSFRNWFRPDYPYVFAGFRCVEN